jgi:hypothetical protein
MSPANSSSTHGVRNRASANMKGSHADRARRYHWAVAGVVALSFARDGHIPKHYPMGTRGKPPVDQCPFTHDQRDARVSRGESPAYESEQGRLSPDPQPTLQRPTPTHGDLGRSGPDREEDTPLRRHLSSPAVESHEESGTGQTGIKVKTKYYALNFMMYFSKPKVSIDGSPPETVRWGETFIATSPGRHTVRCFVPYLHLRHMGDSSIDVVVPSGVTASLQWQTPLGSLYLKGKWTVLNAARPRRPPTG